jgi:hypothetical protein
VTVIGALGPAAVHEATPLTLVFRQAVVPARSLLLAQPALTAPAGQSVQVETLRAHEPLLSPAA